MKNLLETLKSTISELEFLNESSDIDVINRLKANLCLGADDESYMLWMKEIVAAPAQNI